MTTNRQWLLKSRPVGMVNESNFERIESPIPKPTGKQVLVRNLYLSFEPAMRGWLDDVPSYLPPVAIGEPMRASTVAEVIESNNPELPVGALVQGMFGWQEYAIGDPDSEMPPMPLPEGTPPTMPLSVFGGTSFTAYFGFLDVGQPQAGETVVVSGAAGATGSMVVQIAKIKGCRVIGIAGGKEKCQWLREACGCDEVIDYKHESIDEKLSEYCPEGVNIFFDNVGDTMLETLIAHMSDHGRIVMCGQIANYNADQPVPGPANMFQVITKRLRLQGFIVLDYIEQFGEATEKLTEMVMAGQIQWREDIQEGFDNIPTTFLRLFSGENQGKQLLKLADPSA